MNARTFLSPLALVLPSAAQQVAPASAARPLFEPELRVLHEFVGESAGEQFGWIGRNAGDCDGDGVNDVLLSAPTKAIGGPAAGRIFVYSGKSGKLLFARDGQPGDQLGIGIERAGDVNADGHADVIAGAPGALGGRGQALVYSGKDGSIMHRFQGEAAGDNFGRKVGQAGDANGDGHTDVLVGADLCDSVGIDAGRAYLYSGKDGKVLLTLDGEDAGDKFGVSLCGGTARGQTVIVIGAGNAGESQGGRAYVYHGKLGEIDVAYVIEADKTGIELGAMFVSLVGDIDADGTSDVYVSDWQNGANGGAGRIYIYSGREDKHLLTLTGTRAGEGFGIGTADVGDVNGDGHADLLVGAWQNGDGAPSGGKCYLHSGKDGTLLQAWTCTVANETFGFDTTGMGDIDGDGAIDYLITNAWSDVRGPRSGRAFLVAGTKGAPR